MINKKHTSQRSLETILHLYVVLNIRWKFSGAGVCFDPGSTQSDTFCITALAVFLNQTARENKELRKIGM